MSKTACPHRDTCRNAFCLAHGGCDTPEAEKETARLNAERDLLMANVERAGWIAENPLTGKPTHVVTLAWFDEVLEEVNRALDQLGAPDVAGVNKTADAATRERLRLYVRNEKAKSAASGNNRP